MRNRMKRHGATTIGLLTLGAALALSAPAQAAPPNVPQGTADVDGSLSEWSKDPVFAKMYRAGKADKQVESTLKLRYDCSTRVLYAAVETVPGVTIIRSDSDNFIKLGKNDKLVDGGSGDDGIAPDFRYVVENGTTVGWEASTRAGRILPNETYDLNVHAQVMHGGSQTSALEGRSLTIVTDCSTPAASITVDTETSFTRTHNWKIGKSAALSAPAADGSRIATYTVTVDEGSPPASDGGHALTGSVSTTPAATGVTVTRTDASGTATCSVTGGTFTCPTTGLDGTVVARATINGQAVTSGDGYAFNDPALADTTVDVWDTFSTESPVKLGTVTLADVAGAKVWTYTYSRALPAPATGCLTYTNIAEVETTGDNPSAGTSTEVCAPRTPDTPTNPDTPNNPDTPTNPTIPQTPTPVQAPATPQAPAAPAPGGQIAGTATGPATLAIIKVGPARARAGAIVAFRIQVRNTSKIAAKNVVIRDLLPSGYSIVSAKGARLVRTTPVWKVTSLAPGAARTIIVRVRIGARVGGTRVNRAVAVASNASQVVAKRPTRVVRVAGVVRIPRVTG